MDGSEIMTVEEVAKYLKLKPQTVYKWAQEGQIPAAKLGKEWRFRRHLLDEWIDSQIMESKGGQALQNQREKIATDPPDNSLTARIEELPRKQPQRG